MAVPHDALAPVRQPQPFISARNASASASTACASNRRAPLRRTAVSGSSTSSGWRRGTTVLLLVMAYRSSGGSGRLVTRLDTPPFSHRHHPVSAIARTDSRTRGWSGAPSAATGRWCRSSQKLALEGGIEAYNLPLGCISQLYRDIAARRAGLLSRVASTPSSTRGRKGASSTPTPPRTWSG
jgi:hypothetical protein